MTSVPAKAERRRLLRPGTWPVRWRLAMASASLTLGDPGRLRRRDWAPRRPSGLRSDFNRELRDAVGSLAPRSARRETR